MFFFTSDHADGFADIAQLRWQFNSREPKMDVVCSSDAVSPLGFTISCKRFIAHIGDPYLQSGEIAQRHAENNERPLGGAAELINVITFELKNEPQVVWSAGDLRVSAIRSSHIPGHASYRVDTPAGSVVIGGDAGNDAVAPPRATSTSDQVEKLGTGVDIIVHTTMHAVMGPDKDSGMPPAIFYRQATATDLGAMAKRVGAKLAFLARATGDCDPFLRRGRFAKCKWPAMR
jgi:ribonuclease Z